MSHHLSQHKKTIAQVLAGVINCVATIPHYVDI